MFLKSYMSFLTEACPLQAEFVSVFIAVRYMNTCGPSLFNRLPTFYIIMILFCHCTQIQVCDVKKYCMLGHFYAQIALQFVSLCTG